MDLDVDIPSMVQESGTLVTDSITAFAAAATVVMIGSCGCAYMSDETIHRPPKTVSVVGPNDWYRV